MNDAVRSFLFGKHILVNSTGEDPAECFQCVFALANRFGIRITGGRALATPDMIRLAAKELGADVPEPFFRGFPQTVKALTPEKRLYDQLLEYVITYGMGDFSEARHSVFEGPFERIAFREDAEVREFVILDEAAAVRELKGFFDSMLAGTRPLNDAQFDLVCSCIEEYGFRPRRCASRDTAVRLLLRFGDTSYARFLDLPDTIRLVEVMNHDLTGQDSIRKLNLRNRQRKLIAKVLDILLEKCVFEKALRNCFEKRDLWVGLLHHIHYVPRSDTGKRFVDTLRNSKCNLSAYAAFERALAEGGPVKAAEVLLKLKGSSAAARKLNYILSRCRTSDEVEGALGMLGSINPVVSIQMILQYRSYAPEKRVFKFVRFGLMKKHSETAAEMGRRRSAIPGEVCDLAADAIHKNLLAALGKHRAGKVYIDDRMKKIALPLQEGASSSGFGVLPGGSRLPMPEGRKLRCFTYWEKVDDIDLSAFGIDSRGNVTEFSWRTAWDNAASDAIVYSGDVTSGYHGGSEYFDISLGAFKAEYPAVRYVVFADNVFSGVDFSECFCRAGYMIRSEEDSGEVYEPKTVSSAYTIDAKTTYAVLFALDLETKEIVWLNLGLNKRERIAGLDDIRFVLPYFDILDTANIYSLFAAKADTVVSDPEDADVIVSDETFETIREDQVQIHSYDHEKLFRYLSI